ncbi:ras-related protein Rab-9A-like isoform X2 [Branchiostoma floridae]|uniref:Ras-related protein Rab-9A-like isoform X2 n=1 Tax=Branchiostoma floridae TaxID=7739 RepID=A0A9J7LW97_BRAFL|nr:ras-related protein Rab-9A-like isoform X2 [Branchiostoma floridae]
MCCSKEMGSFYVDKQRFPDMSGKKIKAVVLGNAGVGKTCLIRRFADDFYTDGAKSTVGTDMLVKNVEIDGQEVTVELWDTGGQERFWSLRTPFYRETDVCILSFAVDDENSFKKLDAWKDEFEFYADVIDASSFPYAVIATKADVTDRAVSEQAAQAWCKANWDMPYFETSAKNGQNVDKTLTRIAKMACRRKWKSNQRKTVTTASHDSYRKEIQPRGVQLSLMSPLDSHWDMVSVDEINSHSDRVQLGRKPTVQNDQCC